MHAGITGLKYYLIVMYFRKHLDTFGEVSFTLNKLLDECGYSTKSHNDSIYSDFRKIIKEEIIDKGYGYSNEDILKVKPTSLYSIQLSYEKNLFFTNDNFVQISISEFEKIANSKEGKVNKSVLLGVYLYIKQFIISNSHTTDHVLKISYPPKQQIKKVLGISVTTIESAITILSNLCLLYIRSDMYVENDNQDGTYIPTRNVYALTEKDANSKLVLSELEKIYGRKVFNREDVQGEIIYLSPNRKGNY